MFLCELFSWIKNRFNQEEIDREKVNETSIIRGKISLLDERGNVVSDWHSTLDDFEIRDRTITNVKEIRFPPIALTSETAIVNVSTEVKIYGFDSEGDWRLREVRSQIQPIAQKTAKCDRTHSSIEGLSRIAGVWCDKSGNGRELVSEPDSSPSLSANAIAQLKSHFDQGSLSLPIDEDSLRSEMSKLTWGGVIPQENRPISNFIELPRSQPIQSDCDTIVGGAGNIPVISWDWGMFEQTQERIDELRSQNPPVRFYVGGQPQEPRETTIDELRSHLTSVPSPENTKHITIELRSDEPPSDSDTVSGGNWMRSGEEEDEAVYRTISSTQLAQEIISQLLIHSPIPLPEETRIHLARINSNPDGSETIERFSLPTPLKVEIIPDRKEAEEKAEAVRSCSNCDFLRQIHNGMACFAMTGRIAVPPFDKAIDCPDWEPIDQCDRANRNRATEKRVFYVEKESPTD